MELHCKRCGAAIDADNVNLDRLIAKREAAGRLPSPARPRDAPRRAGRKLRRRRLEPVQVRALRQRRGRHGTPCRGGRRLSECGLRGLPEKCERGPGG